jgi:hypothetical protein
MRQKGGRHKGIKATRQRGNEATRWPKRHWSFILGFRLTPCGSRLVSAWGLRLGACSFSLSAFSIRLAAQGLYSLVAQLTAALRYLYSIFKFSNFQIFKFAHLPISTSASSSFSQETFV